MSLPVLTNPVPPVQVYNGTSSAPNLKVGYFTAVTVNGVATIHTTLDGTATGTPMFSSILHADATPWVGTTTSTQMPWVSGNQISTDLRTVTFNVLTGTTVVLSSASSQLVSAATTISACVFGLP